MSSKNKQTVAAPVEATVEPLITEPVPSEGETPAPVEATVESIGHFVSDGIYKGDSAIEFVEPPLSVDNLTLSKGEMKAVEDSWAHKPELPKETPSEEEESTATFFNPKDFDDVDYEDKLQIKFPNGETYEVEVAVVAAHYATTTVDPELSIGSETWLKAFNDTYENEELMLEWLKNQMCWDDFERRTTLITAKVPGYQDHANEWLRAEFVFFV